MKVNSIGVNTGYFNQKQNNKAKQNTIQSQSQMSFSGRYEENPLYRRAVKRLIPFAYNSEKLKMKIWGHTWKGLGYLWDKTFNQDEIRDVQKDINKAIKEKNNYLDRKNKLLEKKRACEIEKLEAKHRIREDFLDKLSVEKKGYEITDKELNGVLITGKSKETRDEMVNWIIRESGVYNEKVVFDKNKPLESMKQISEKARNAEAIFPVKNIRTIVYVENLDDFLADQSSENRKRIAMWNDFAAEVSEQYHTTILFQSDKPEKLEAASVAPHRVGLEVNLNSEYTEADKKEEEKCNKKLASFEKYASEGRSWDYIALNEDVKDKYKYADSDDENIEKEDLVEFLNEYTLDYWEIESHIAD